MVNTDPQPPPSEVIEILRQEHPPEVLYSEDIIRGRTTIYHILKNYIVLNGVKYNPSPHIWRIIHGLLESFFEE